MYSLFINAGRGSRIQTLWKLVSFHSINSHSTVRNAECKSPAATSHHKIKFKNIQRHRVNYSILSRIRYVPILLKRKRGQPAQQLNVQVNVRCSRNSATTIFPLSLLRHVFYLIVTFENLIEQLLQT